MNKNENLNGYITFYQSKRLEIYAASSYAAQKETARLLKISPKKEYLISVCLCESKGEQVYQSTNL